MMRPDGDNPSPATSCPARILRYDGSETLREIDVALESPLNLIYGTIPYAVMMVSPADLTDFVTGFSFTEGLITSTADIRDISLHVKAEGLIAGIDLVPDALRKHLARRRNLSGRTSCGLCGVESLDQIPGAGGPVTKTTAIAPTAIARALSLLDNHQPLSQRTRAVHAAAWCDQTGTILIAREDVGRHNALDKTIGACLRAGLSPAGGFMLITSRCSFEMIEKTAIFGAATIVAISAPTSLAIARAKTLGVTMIAIARHDSAIIFTDTI